MRSDERIISSTILQSRAGRGFAMAMTLDTVAPAKADGSTSTAPAGRWRRLARPGLGLRLSAGVAAIWATVVWLGLSDGRLVPPPSKVFTTIVELARSGELFRHIV